MLKVRVIDDGTGPLSCNGAVLLKVISVDPGAELGPDIIDFSLTGRYEQFAGKRVWFDLTDPLEYCWDELVAAGEEGKRLGLC